MTKTTDTHDPDTHDPDAHVSVLLEETVAAMALTAGDVAVDCTVGGGGHTARLLAAVAPGGTVLGLDRDLDALARVRARLAEAERSGALRLSHAPFSELGRIVEAAGLTGRLAAVCADIGVSSMHLDQAGRGFSFQNDGPLDMRMDQSQGRTAADLVAELGEVELARLFFELGEEPKSRQIARRIVSERATNPVTTTAHLAALVKDAARYKTPSRKHPATRVFQALRIAVNDELGELAALLDQAFAALRPGGRLAVISFHSLEDRIVKTKFIGLTGRREREGLPRDLPMTDAVVQRLAGAKAEIVKPFPLVPTAAECQRNPRARSAKLRVLTKL